MIHGNLALLQERDWRRTLRDAVTDPGELLARLRLPAGLAAAAACRFPLRVPEPYLARIRPGDPDDPLLLQVLPRADELRSPPGYSADPVGDLGAVDASGLLKKYHGRALSIATGNCAIHCRFCFRREFPYAVLADADPSHLAEALANSGDVDELIFSGGDPLTLGDGRLARLVEAAAAATRVRRIRFHTRLPVVIPERVTGALCRLLSNCRPQVLMVIHANHANEIDHEVAAAVAALAAAGATLLNQSVLLRGVNDRVEALTELSERLFAIGVMPYYLHALDRVLGTAHFDLPAARAVALHASLRDRLPGYLVPRLVREIAGMGAKQPLPEAAGNPGESC